MINNNRKRDNKSKLVPILVLTIAGLIVAFLYSPVANPDLYQPTKFIGNCEGVCFGGKIQNAPKKSSSPQFDNIVAPQIISKPYAASAGYKGEDNAESAQLAGNPASNYEAGRNLTNRMRGFQSGSGLGGGLGINTQNNENSRGLENTRVQASGMSQTNTTSTYNNTYGNSTALSTDRSTNPGINPQSNGSSSFANNLASNSTYQSEDFNGMRRSKTDDPPPPDGLPIGDGSYFLMLLLGLYAVWKMRRFPKSKNFLDVSGYK
jgi:hypothetical protein